MWITVVKYLCLELLSDFCDCGGRGTSMCVIMVVGFFTPMWNTVVRF